MSYILDALRRADAEREREKGAVPGLHARPLASAAPDPAPMPARPQGLWLALGVALGLLAALAWWVLGRPASAPAPAPAPAPIVQVVPVPVPVPAATPAPAAPPLAAAPAPALAAPATAPPAGPAPAATPGSAANRPRPVTAPPAAAAPAPAPAVAVAGDAGPAVAQPREAPAAAPVASAAPAAAPRALPLAQLSPDLRREMPPMTVGGSVYSDSPASRFVIINGQVVREGEGAATGVTVERIGPKSAVLRWRDLRIEVPL